MKNKVLEDIKNYATQRLKDEYGYCGVADGPNVAMLNSSDGPEDITIIIKCVADDGGETA